MKKFSFLDSKHEAIFVVDNFYTKKELGQIKEELTSLRELTKLKIFTNNSVSLDEDGKPLQKSSSLFLDTLYGEKRDLSKILNINRKIFDSDFIDSLSNKNIFFTYLRYSNRDSTLVNFYEPKDHYKNHRDATCITAITFFEIEKFLGGDLFFSEYDLSIEAVDNRVVLFPGFMLHAARDVTKGTRASMAQFINYVW